MWMPVQRAYVAWSGAALMSIAALSLQGSWLAFVILAAWIGSLQLGST